MNDANNLAADFVDAAWKQLDEDSAFVPALTQCYVYSSGAGCRNLADGALRARVHVARRRLDRKSRRFTAFVQRALTAAAVLFAGACVLALLVG